MKKIALILIALTLVLASCKKKEGSITFTTNADTGGGLISVDVSGGSNGTIVNIHPSGATCGTSDALKFILLKGDYTYNAADVLGSWSGSFTIEKNGCITQELTQ